MNKVRNINRISKNDLPAEVRIKMNQAIRMYILDRMDVSEIAKELGVSDKTIHRYLSYGKVMLRPRNRDNRGRYIPS
jgi:DNA-directed RNA polymerase specialized sigma24 family protein